MAAAVQVPRARLLLLRSPDTHGISAAKIVVPSRFQPPLRLGWKNATLHHIRKAPPQNRTVPHASRSHHQCSEGCPHPHRGRPGNQYRMPSARFSAAPVTPSASASPIPPRPSISSPISSPIFSFSTGTWSRFPASISSRRSSPGSPPTTCRLSSCFPPIISAETRREALAVGATDFLSKPFNTSELLLRIRNLLRIRLLHRRLQDAHQELEIQVIERTTALEETLAELRSVRAAIGRPLAS